jgi:trimeric autotransporter adhesin
MWSVPSTTTSTSPDGTPSVFNGLPPGLSISQAGVISGTPTDTFNGMVTLQVVDNGNFSATRVLALVIGPHSNGKSQTVSLVPSTTSTVPYYGTFTVTATSSANITPTLTISGSCQQLSSSGNVYSFRMTSGAGDCNVSAMWPGSNGYATAFADTSITAVPAFTAITITGAPSAAAYGSSFTVAATSNVGVTPTITATGACTISSNRVTMVPNPNTGNCLLSASIMPGTANYSEATADLTVPTVPANGNSCNGFYTGTFNGNITVAPNQICAISGGTVAGNLQSNGGIVILTNNATVKRNLQITGTATHSAAPA